MISNKADGIVQLIRGQNMVIIKELFDVSFFTNETFISALRTCFSTKYSSFDSEFIIEIVNLLSNNFGDECLKQDKFILNHLITKINFGNQCDINSICFRKLTDMGAIVDDNYNFILNIVPHDDFFYYAAKNKIKINVSMLSSAVGNRESYNVHMCDWIFDQWESGDIGFDLQQLSHIVSAAYYRKDQTYLARIMQKICHHVNIEVIIIYVMITCQYIDEIDKIMEYTSECVHYNELVTLAMIKTHWGLKKKDRYAKKDGSVIKTDSVKSLIAEDKEALAIYKKIIVMFDKFDVRISTTSFDNFLNNLLLFTNMIDN